MIIEGNLLIGVLIVVALAIAALVVFIRFAVKKEPSSEADSLFARFLRFGEKDEQDDAQDAATTAEAPLGAGGLSLPMPGHAGGKATAEEENAKKSPLSVNLGGLFAGVLGSRKNKEQIKEEVRAIDEQLNSVLHETEEINVLGAPPQISPDDSLYSDSKGMRELDMEMGNLQGPLEIITPEELKPEPPALDMASPAQAATPKPEDAAVNLEKKPDAPQTPAEAEAAKPKVDFMADDKKGAGDDLLSDLEASTKQEETIDLSIMKEYQDMPITCVEIESDLKSILDQITINGQNRRSPGR